MSMLFRANSVFEVLRHQSVLEIPSSLRQLYMSIGDLVA